MTTPKIYTDSQGKQWVESGEVRRAVEGERVLTANGVAENPFAKTVNEWPILIPYEPEQPTTEPQP